MRKLNLGGSSQLWRKVGFWTWGPVSLTVALYGGPWDGSSKLQVQGWALGGNIISENIPEIVVCLQWGLNAFHESFQNFHLVLKGGRYLQKTNVKHFTLSQTQ